MSNTTYECCLELPHIYTFTDGQKDARELQAAKSAGIDKYLMGVKVHLSSLNCDIDGEEIILELPDFVHLLVRVCVFSINIPLLF